MLVDMLQNITSGLKVWRC